jgi:hypothetical protein
LRQSRLNQRRLFQAVSHMNGKHYMGIFFHSHFCLQQKIGSKYRTILQPDQFLTSQIFENCSLLKNHDRPSNSEMPIGSSISMVLSWPKIIFLHLDYICNTIITDVIQMETDNERSHENFRSGMACLPGVVAAFAADGK